MIVDKPHKSITQLNNIFSSKDISFLLQDSSQALENEENLKSNYFWDETVKEYSKPILIKTLESSSKAYKIINSRVSEITGKVPESINYYFWGPGSYIPWHNDALYTTAVTIYLNETWDVLHGGLFQYIFNNQILTLTPKLNTGVIQTGGVYHSTTIQSSASPVRKSIQLWFSEKKSFL